MFNLVQITENTYYIDCPSKIGIYKTSEDKVFLIDSGNDSDAGRKILKILEKNNWTLEAIINTHSNADHIGGNNFLQKRTGCKIYTSGIEKCFTEHPVLEPSFLYGGFPDSSLRNKFLMAKPSSALDISEAELPEGFEIFKLKGHFFDMIGVRTPDDICFIADSVFGRKTIEKYHISFIYDVKGFLETLDYLEKMECKTFVPSHADVTDDIHSLVSMNRNKVIEILDRIMLFCRDGLSMDELISNIFSSYDLTMNMGQYVLVGSTIRSMVSYLCDSGRLSVSFEDNLPIWKTQEIVS